MIPRIRTARSVATIFAEHGFRCSGFDYLRITLAFGVFLWHGSSIVSYGPTYDSALHNTPFGTLARTILPMFFALSGFLVAGSLFRSGSLMTYASNRILRIFPALVVEVTLSALVLGALVTTLSLSQYYSSHEFIRYLGNAFGIVYVYLPGVFKDNPITWVNISLWTVPYELECYIVLLALAALNIARRPIIFLAFFMGMQIFFPIIDMLGQDRIAGINRVPPRVLVLCFLAGVGIFLFRDRIPVNRTLFAVCMVLSLVLVANGQLAYFVPIPVAYATVYLGLLNPRRVPLIFGGDYSYGLYLYAFPFQQLQAHLFPEHRGWLENLVFALPCTIVFAVFSWHVIEKPILTRRKRIVAVIENRWSLLQRRWRRS